MKRLLSVLLCVMMIITALPLMISNAEGTENPFTDVKEGKWYTEAVLWCYENGYMAGVSATEFGVNTPVTREMFVTLLAKIDGADLSVYAKDTEGLPFTDIKAGYYIRALKWAYENKYTSGVSATEFGTGKPVSREQLATFLRTYAAAKGVDVSATVDLSTYADGANVSKYARAAMGWAIASEMITGTGNNMLSPKMEATRAQVAVIIKKFVGNVLSARHLTITAEGTTARITEAGDLAFMMYAKGDAYTDDEFITAYCAEFGMTEEELTVEFAMSHNFAQHDDLDGNDSLTIEGLYGSYTFHVVYRDQSSENISVYFDPENEYPVGQITINGSDISEYVIVYGRTPNTHGTDAAGLAGELSAMIAEMTGITLPVYSDTEATLAEGAKEILIGHTNREETGFVTVDRSALIYDTLHVEVQGSRVILTGKETESGGTHMAVYEFLRRLGCTYYTASIYHIEPAEKIELPDGYTVHIRPTMDMHVNYQLDGWNYKIGQTSETGLRFCNVVHTIPCFAAEDYEDTWECHIKYYMAPEPCLSDPTIINRIIQNVKIKISHALAAGNSEPLVWLTMSDGSARGCQCKACKKTYGVLGAHSTYSFILKYVGDAIAEEYPTAKVVGLAYKYTITAPKTDVTDEAYAQFVTEYTAICEEKGWSTEYIPPQRLHAPDTAVMCICSDNSCFSHAIDDPDCHNKGNSNITFNQNFERYCSMFDNVMVWEYWTADYARFSVFPNIYEMWYNFNYYYRHGVTGMYGLGHTERTADFCELHTYIDAVLSLDSSLTIEEFFLKVNKFLEVTYGPGWKEMRAFIDLTEELSNKNEFNNWMQSKWTFIISEEDWRAHIDEMDAMFVSALEAAQNDRQRMFVNAAYSTVKYSYVRLAWLDYKASGSNEDFELFKAANRDYRDTTLAGGLEMPEKWQEDLDPVMWEINGG